MGCTTDFSPSVPQADCPALFEATQCRQRVNSAIAHSSGFGVNRRQTNYPMYEEYQTRKWGGLQAEAKFWLGSVRSHGTRLHEAVVKIKLLGSVFAWNIARNQRVGAGLPCLCAQQIKSVFCVAALLVGVVDHQAPQQQTGRIEQATGYRTWNFWIKQHCEAYRRVGSIDCAQPAARIEKPFRDGGRVRRHVTALLLAHSQASNLADRGESDFAQLNEMLAYHFFLGSHGYPSGATRAGLHSLRTAFGSYAASTEECHYASWKKQT